MAQDQPRGLGLLGLFDLDNLDVQVRVRVAVQEIASRRPDLTLRLFAPFGVTRPIPVAADLPLEPLAPLTTARRAALERELDALVVIGDIKADASWYEGHPAFDPRDVAACVEFLDARPTSTLCGHDPDEPHPALLARRVWPFGVCEQRREFLRAMQWWPQRGAPVVIVGDDDDIDAIDGIAGRLQIGDRAVTVVGCGITGERFADAAFGRLRRRAHYIPPRASSIDDRVAAVAGASSVVSSSAAAFALADAYGRPRLTIEAFAATPASRAARRAPATFAADEAALDRGYDGLAALAPGDLAGALAPGETTALRAALDAQAQRTAHERVVLADYVRAVRNNAEQEAAELRNRIAEHPLRRVRNSLRRRA